MLVMSAKKNEQIIIGGHDGYPEITIMVVEIRGDKVRLGFEAPLEVQVDRKVVRDAKIANGQFTPSGTDPKDCPVCEGSGGIDGLIPGTSQECSICGGSGKQ